MHNLNEMAGRYGNAIDHCEECTSSGLPGGTAAGPDAAGSCASPAMLMMSFLWPDRVRRHKKVSISWHRHLAGENMDVFLNCPQVAKALQYRQAHRRCQAHPAANDVIPTPAEQQLRLNEREEREDASSVTAQYPAIRATSSQEGAISWLGRDCQPCARTAQPAGCQRASSGSWRRCLRCTRTRRTRPAH